MRHFNTVCTFECYVDYVPDIRTHLNIFTHLGAFSHSLSLFHISIENERTEKRDCERKQMHVAWRGRIEAKEIQDKKSEPGSLVAN